MSDTNIQDTELLTAETDSSSNYNISNIRVKDKYACFVLQNSVNFNQSKRENNNINACKSSALCIGRSLNMSIASQSTLATQLTRRTSIQSTLIKQKQFKQIFSQTDIDSCNMSEVANSRRVYAKQNSVIMNQIDNFLENTAFNQNNQQDDTFHHIIKSKLNSKQTFEDIYGINNSSKRDRYFQFKARGYVKASQHNEFYDRSSQGSSDCSSGCITGDQSQDHQITIVPEYQSLKQNPPLPQAEVKEKQFRSKSVLASDKLPSIKKVHNFQAVRESRNFNLKKSTSPQIVKQSPQQKQISCSFLEEQDSSINQIQFDSPQKLRSQSKYQTPIRGDSNKKLKQSVVKIDESSVIAQEYFKLISGKEDSQHLQFIRINRNQIKQYLSSIYDNLSAELFMTFVDFPQIISFQNLLNKIEQFANCSSQEFCLFAFLLYDINSDGYVCNQDLYNRWKTSDNQMGQDDVNNIVRYAQYQLNNRELAIQTIKILKQQQQAVRQNNSEFNIDQQEESDVFELENSIIKGNKFISLQRYRQLKSKNSLNLPDVQSRQYTYYLKSFQVQEHYSNQRFIQDEIGTLKQIEKSIVIKKIQYNKLTGDFNLNFKHFCEIFRTEAPRIIYDMIASLTGYLFENIHYPYSEQENFQQKMQLSKRQQAKLFQQEELNKQALLENKSQLKQQLEQKSNLEIYKLQFSQMLSNKQ